MSKIKMRCISCGKWFQSANAKEVTCPDCMQKARKEKMASKTPSTPATPNKTTGSVGQGSATPTRTPPPPKPKPAASGSSHWLDTLSDVKVGEPEQPPTRPKLPPSPPQAREQRGGPERPGPRGPGGYREERGPGGYREERDRGPGGRETGGRDRGPGGYREPGYRGPGAYSSGLGISGTIGQRPRQPMETGFPRGPRPGGPGGPGGPGEGRPDKPRYGPGTQKGGKPKAAKPPAPPKPKREKIPPPPPFTPTPEQIAQVEARYIELATPSEFDGIRTQISKEIGIPKKAVKKIIKDLRDREHIPSWWELQTYKGPSEELEKIKELYVPHLPLPPVGVHKTIADQLELKPSTVYQAIKAIRQEMGLPQFNDPALHGLELKKPGEDRQGQTQEGEKPESEAPVVADTVVETAEQTVATTDTATETSAEAVATTDTAVETPEAVVVPTDTTDTTGTTGTIGTTIETPEEKVATVASDGDEAIEK